MTARPINARLIRLATLREVDHRSAADLASWREAQVASLTARIAELEFDPTSSLAPPREDG